MINERTKVKEILKLSPQEQEITLMGWVRTFRNNQFIAFYDGSTVENIQVILPLNNFSDDINARIHTGTSLKIKGNLVASQGKGQQLEILAKEVEILGDCDAEKYPLQPKKHSLDFLREIAHLRMRTVTFNAVFKIRHALAFAVHEFFHNKGFSYWHCPIITGSDCEGAGEMFQVTTLDLNKIPLENGRINFSKDFFGKPTNLTVSGQLEGELAMMGMGEIYTFGPTFRAENSNTPRHLAEFWMIEPEMAFYDIEDNMNLAEEFIQYVIAYALKYCPKELKILATRLTEEEKQKPQQQRSEMTLLEKLDFILNNKFERITYTEAIDILLASPTYKKHKFKYEVKWGVDLQSEHERYLVEKHFKKPVIIIDYPASIKAFYMRINEDRKTVRGMDILFPGIGEIVGGSQREERYDILLQRMQEMHIPIEEMQWYLDTRRFGTVPHSGFGLGFERLVLFVTGMTNIRDVIPFARTPKNCEF
ncbi:MAG: asparagine--tRNA ligase [Chitinophagaceae bacterium]